MTERDAASAGQVTSSAAEIYEDFFVPALFGQWPARLIDLAGVQPGDAVLDVGCGTGILARAAYERVGSTGQVAGVDPNEGMLAVARRADAPIDWHEGPAESLPFADRSFDHVLSQFAFMFFVDSAVALREMVRVTRTGGTVTIATWASAEESPGYAALIDVLDRRVGPDAANALRAPFRIGTEAALHSAIEDTLPAVVVTRHDGTARFPSLADWMLTEVRGWTLDDAIDDRQFDELVEAASTELASFVQPDGTIEFAAPALIARAVVDR